MTGLEALCATLSDLGVRHVFGLPGTQNAELFNVLPEHGIRPVLTTHELSASFMANGYARASGRPGVLATIPGPGFTFALPGLAEARLDSVPLLHLVGTPVRGPGRFGHQAIDQAGIAGPLVKGVVEVTSAGQIRERLDESYHLALEGEPGPVIVHLSRDALRAKVGELPKAAWERAHGQELRGRPEWTDELLAIVTRARRPVLFVGGGALDCSRDVTRLMERLSAPTFTTVTARGVLPEDHRCSIPFDADRGGVDELNELLDRSDLILALGCKFSHNGTAGFGMRLPPDRLVHVNTDAKALGSGYAARLKIQARVEEVLGVLLKELDSGRHSSWTSAELSNFRAHLGSSFPPRMPEPRFEGVPGGSAQAFFQALRAALPRDAVLVTDSGLHQVMTRRYYEVMEARGLITPSDFQSMGFGLPAAIGAALAVPQRPVVAIVGDGGFLISAMDLVCAVRERVPVVVVVFNDGYLNLIRLQQLRDQGGGAAVRLATPDLEGLAAATSIRYGRLDRSVEETIRRALNARTPTLLEVRLGDSSAIRAARRRGLARKAVRRTLGEEMADRLKQVWNLFRHH